LKTRAHLFVSGRVQGVFFRQRTRDIAESVDVTGWVRNFPDGRVEAVFEGEENAVKALVEFCRHGPRNAVVASIEVVTETFTGEFNSFEVRY
jgi:acylphosphatase